MAGEFLPRMDTDGHGFLSTAGGYSVEKPLRLFGAGRLSWPWQPEKRGSPMRILIIDDEENIRRIAVVMLEAAKIFGIMRDTLHRKKKEMSRDPDVPGG
jgi:hypothetical protein